MSKGSFFLQADLGAVLLEGADEHSHPDTVLSVKVPEEQCVWGTPRTEEWGGVSSKQKGLQVNPHKLRRHTN